MQAAHSGPATEAEADCKVAEEVWQALVWLSQRRSNFWPVLFPSLHACSGELTRRSELHAVLSCLHCIVLPALHPCSTGKCTMAAQKVLACVLLWVSCGVACLASILFSAHEDVLSGLNMVQWSAV